MTKENLGWAFGGVMVVLMVAILAIPRPHPPQEASHANRYEIVPGSGSYGVYVLDREEPAVYGVEFLSRGTDAYRMVRIELPVRPKN